MDIQSFDLSIPLGEAVDSVFGGFPSTVKDRSLNRTKGESLYQLYDLSH